MCLYCTRCSLTGAFMGLFLLFGFFFGWNSFIYGSLIMFLISWNFCSFMVYELMGVSILTMMLMVSNSFERVGSLWYSLYLTFVLGSLFLYGFSGSSLVMMVFILAKMPVFGLHHWLPKVHAEASMMISAILAGLILKLGVVVYYYLSSNLVWVGLGFFMCSVWMLLVVDIKSIIAYSSVLHMSLSCGVLNVIFLLSFVHTIVSPMMFLSVYLGYLMWSGRNSLMCCAFVLLVNLGFPFISGFWGEVYVSSVASIVFVLSYLMALIFSGKIYLMSKGIGMGGMIGILLVGFLI